jgi:hypothetical protein
MQGGRRATLAGMKRAITTIALMLLVIAAAGAQAKPDFSGKWVLDVAKSDFGQAPAPESIVHVVVHKEPNVTITTTQKSGGGETTNERKLTTDGKENVNRLKMMGGEQEAKSTSKWDGGKLTTTTKLDMQGMAVELQDTWELSDGGKVLTVVRQTTAPQGSLTQKFVFNKQ